MSRRRAERRRLHPFEPADLTPMVDVVFLLIVFFVLVSQLTRTERTPITPPALPAELLTPPPVSERIVVHVEAGGLRLGADRLPLEPGARAALASRLRSILAASPGAPVLLRAPRDAPYADVAVALAAMREAGALDVRLIAREIAE